MRRAIHSLVRLTAETVACAGPVVEIGALYLPGYEALSNLRPHFAGRRYVGCDLRFGPGVDQLHDATRLGLRDRSVGTVLLLETLEHLAHPQQALAEAHRVLRDDGILILSVPFTYRLHGFPSDYWRFTASGVHMLVSHFGDSLIVSVGPELKPAFIFAVAAKTASAGFANQKTALGIRIEQAFRQPRARLRGHVSLFKERARDFFGQLLGRAAVTVRIFDPAARAAYAARDLAVPTEAGHD
jgi:SAM-dependent methyltransferase